MATLISNNETLLRYIPNTLKAVSGEQTLFDKIRYHLLQSETWLTQTFISSETLSRIKAYSDATPLLHHCRMALAADAMLHAVPQLDLVLTPNGFGIVSNANIAPASKERIERLLASLEKLRDDALNVILTMLPEAHQWTSSSQYDYFVATMFPTLDIVNNLGHTDHLWQRYQDIRAQLLNIEARFETEYFSRPLMDVLRQANIMRNWYLTTSPVQYARLYRRIAALEFSILRTGEYPVPSIIDTVNLIRTAKNPIFSEWKNSDTAKLYGMQGYQNDKNKSGYFF